MRLAIGIVCVVWGVSAMAQVESRPLIGDYRYLEDSGWDGTGSPPIPGNYKYLRQRAYDEPARPAYSPPGGWRAGAQYGSEATVLRPAYGPQRGTQNTIVVPNYALPAFQIAPRQRSWSIAIPLPTP